MKDQNPPNEVASEALHGAPLGAQSATPQGQISSNPANIWRGLLDKARLTLMPIFNKFYSNKKIFWPVSVALGLIFLIILLGLLFGKRRVVQNVSKSPIPSPIVQATPEATNSGNVIIDSQNKLNILKNQINNLDVKQSRLQPPVLNFSLKF